MEPRFVMLDGAGTHNADLAKTRVRVAKTGAWKRQRIVVIVPAGEKIRAEAALSWIGLAFPPNNGVCRILAQGLEVGEAYSQAIENVLAHPELSTWEYILTIEHDNLPPADGVVKLVEAMENNPKYSCIGGLYFTKGEGGVPQIWGDPKDPVVNFRPQLPDPNGGLVECCGTGMGFNLWRMSMFKDKNLRKPWFKTLNGKDGQGVGTQDLFAWTDMRKNGHRCAIDCSVKVGHIDDNGFVW